MEKGLLQSLVDQSKTLDQIASEVGKSRTDVRYWLKKYDIVRQSRRQRWSDEQMKKALSSSATIADALRALGLKVRPGNYSTVRKFIKSQCVDISHMTGYACGNRQPQYSIEDVAIENSHYSRSHLKRRLLSAGVLKNQCSLCGQKGIWKGKPLRMVLDHVNGVNNDHRIENLRMLCPNCNSQQSTFCGRNRKGEQ